MAKPMQHTWPKPFVSGCIQWKITSIVCKLIQAEGLGFAYNTWRRDFRSPSNEVCPGALIWQLNDSWPGALWALVDICLRPKSAYTMLLSARCKSFAIGLEQVAVDKLPITIRSYREEKKKVTVWVASSDLQEVMLSLTLSGGTLLTSGKQVKLPQPSIDVVLKPNRIGGFVIGSQLSYQKGHPS